MQKIENPERCPTTIIRGDRGKKTLKKKKNRIFFPKSTYKIMTNLLERGREVDTQCCRGEEGGKTVKLSRVR